MATYAQLKGLIDGSTDDGGLRGKVLVASLVKAEGILAEVSPTADRLAFASDVLDKPEAALDGLFNYVLAANDTASVATITGATDAAIQTNVDAAIDALHP